MSDFWLQNSDCPDSIPLRLVPLFPFFLVNLLSGLTSLKLLTCYGVSQPGMLLGTIAFVYAGTQLAQIESLELRSTDQ